MSKGTCFTCSHCEDAPTKPGGDWQGWCLYDPPTPALIMSPGPPSPLTGQPSINAEIRAIRAPVTATDRCSHYDQEEEPPKEIPILGEAEPILDKKSERELDIANQDDERRHVLIKRDKTE